MSSIASQNVGFSGYPDICSDIIADMKNTDWFYPRVSALCIHGIPITQNDGLLHPADELTKSDWQIIANHLNAYLDTPVDRISGIEAINSVFLGDYPNFEQKCESAFLDIADNSMECQITNTIVNNGIITGYANGYFGPHDNFNWAEIAKLFTVGAGLTKLEATGCSGAEPTLWYADYTDTLCEKGYIEPGSMAGNKPTETPTKREVYKLAWDIQLDKDGY